MARALSRRAARRIVDSAAGPEARYETREAVTLAFLTALHRLPPRQRAVLVLRDVLGFSATEVAAMLDTTPTSVNSALIRARATIEERGPRAHDRAPLPRSAQEHELVARFADAFERGEVEPIVALLAEDAWWTMPPEPYGYQGHDAIKQFIAHAFATRETPAASFRRGPIPNLLRPYVKDPHADVGRALSLLVLTLDGDRISHITRFAATSALPHSDSPERIPWRAMYAAEEFTNKKAPGTVFFGTSIVRTSLPCYLALQLSSLRGAIGARRTVHTRPADVQ